MLTTNLKLRRSAHIRGVWAIPLRGSLDRGRVFSRRGNQQVRSFVLANIAKYALTGTSLFAVGAATMNSLLVSIKRTAFEQKRLELANQKATVIMDRSLTLEERRERFELLDQAAKELYAQGVPPAADSTFLTVLVRWFDSLCERLAGFLSLPIQGVRYMALALVIVEFLFLLGLLRRLFRKAQGLQGTPELEISQLRHQVTVLSMENDGLRRSLNHELSRRDSHTSLFPPSRHY